MKRESSVVYIFGFILLGFLLGLVIAGFATLVALYSADRLLTLDNLLSIQAETPLLWIIDSFPFILAIIMGVLGAREARLDFLRREERAVQKRAADLRKLNLELVQKDRERREIEAMISRGKKEWEATFDSVEDMILLTDEEGVVQRCNRAVIHAFQTDFNGVLGKHADELFFGSQRSQGESLPVDKRELKFPALEGWYEVTSNALVSGGLQQGTIYIIRNITDRKQAALDLQRQKQYYETLMKNSPIAIVTLSLDQRVVACNPAFESMFGYRQPEILGLELDKLITPDNLMQEAQAFTDNVKQGEIVRKITQRHRKDGRLVDVEQFGIPVILWGKQIGIFSLYHDVTELVRPLEEGAAEELQYQAAEAPAEVQPFEDIDELGEMPATEEGEWVAEYSETAPPAETAAEMEEIGETELGAGTTAEAGLEEEPETGHVTGLETTFETPPEISPEEEAGVQATIVELPADEGDAPTGSETASEGQFGGVAESTTQIPSEPESLAGGALAEAAGPIAVTQITGIGPTFAAKLAEAGVRTTADLLELGTLRQSRRELAEKTGISDKLIRKWVQKADILRVPGTDEEQRDLLEAAGVDTVEELAGRSPEVLFLALVEINQRREITSRPVEFSEVEAWIRSAQQLELVNIE